MTIGELKQLLATTDVPDDTPVVYYLGEWDYWIDAGAVFRECVCSESFHEKVWAKPSKKEVGVPVLAIGNPEGDD